MEHTGSKEGPDKLIEYLNIIYYDGYSKEYNDMFDDINYDKAINIKILDTQTKQNEYKKFGVANLGGITSKKIIQCAKAYEWLHKDHLYPETTEQKSLSELFFFTYNLEQLL